LRRRSRHNFNHRKITLNNSPIAEWGIATRPRPGESSSGDRHLVLELPDSLLMAVVDGAGHGPEAAEAAELAIQCLASNASSDMSLYNLINHCHKRLRGTRGGVISLGLINAKVHSLSWLGVGNVEGAVFRAVSGKTGPARLLLRTGVVGMWLPSLKPHTLALAPGDTVVFVTGGVDNRFFMEELPPMNDSQALADRIVHNYGRQTDDALALVVRYKGARI
jgi:negative regulator of sigma-B (phosphoserine phosphatase)